MVRTRRPLCDTSAEANLRLPKSWASIITLRVAALQSLNFCDWGWILWAWGEQFFVPLGKFLGCFSYVFIWRDTLIRNQELLAVIVFTGDTLLWWLLALWCVFPKEDALPLSLRPIHSIRTLTSASLSRLSCDHWHPGLKSSVLSLPLVQLMSTATQGKWRKHCGSFSSLLSPCLVSWGGYLSDAQRLLPFHSPEL